MNLNTNTDGPRGGCTFIKNLFKHPSERKPVDDNDPFISTEILQNCSSLCAMEPSGLPNYVLSDPTVPDILDISRDVLEDIAKIQIQREKRDEEEDALEAKKKAEKAAADQIIRKPLDCQVDQVFSKNQFFLKKSCPVMIPYKSNLTHEEHMAYLRAFVRFQIKPPRTQVEAEQFDYYMSLQNRVYEEQTEFNKFSFQVASLQLTAYNTVPESIVAYVDQYVKHRCKRALQYKQFYIQEQQIPILPQDPTKKFVNLTFTHVGHLLSLGRVPWFYVLNSHQCHTLAMDDTVASKQPPAPAINTQHNILHKTPVSEDKNAAYLAQKHRANVVITSSALKVLADNYGPKFDKVWDIPVVVKFVQVQDADGNQVSHRVVFIDKPMPQKSWMPIEKKQLFYKKSALALMTRVRLGKFFRMWSPTQFRYCNVNESDGKRTAEVNKQQAEYDEDFFDLTAVSTNDSFGAVGTSEPPPMQMGKKNKNKSNLSEESDTLLIAETANNDEEAANNSENICSSPTLGMKKKSVDNEACEAGTSTSPSGSPSYKRKRKCTYQGKSAGKITMTSNKFGAQNDEAKKTSATDLSPDSRSHVNTATDTKAGNASSNSPNVLENLLDMQDSLLKPAQAGNSVHESVNQEVPRQTNPMPWFNSLRTDWTDHLQPQSCPEESGSNVHYQLFSLGLPTNPNQPASNAASPIRIIVRHNIHGLSKFRDKNSFKSKDKKLSKLKDENKTSKAYVVYSKPESQTYFGCEVNTLSEITQKWIHLLVRPNTTLLQVRVCENSGDIMLAEEKDLATVVKEGKQPHIGFSPCVPLATLHSVFTATTGLPSGQFLLHHRPNTKAFILLMKAVESQTATQLTTLDLHQDYSGNYPSSLKYTTPPWLAIDTHILTPFHLKHHKIPATFPMKNPHKKLTMDDRRKKDEKAKNKKRLTDLYKPQEDTEQDNVWL